jgi:hypothetical protein
MLHKKEKDFCTCSTELRKFRTKLIRDSRAKMFSSEVLPKVQKICKVEYTESMTKIVFTTVSGYTFPATFTVTGATMIVDGLTVTFVLDTPATSFEINKLPNQIRFNSVGVYTA